MKTGDVVTLKSGGPLMTIDNSLGRSDEVYCIWMGSDDRCHGRWFPKDCLQPVPSAGSIIKSS